jgi:thioredoxin-related protein
MRRVVTVVMIVMVASALAACGGAPATTTNTPAVVPTANQPVNTAQTGASANADIYSPTQTVTPGEKLSTDAALVPASVLANEAAGKPMLIFFNDPTTKVTTDQVKEITAAVKNYTGLIHVVSFDYTVGIASSATSATIDAETQKIEHFAASLKVNTTPYIVFADKYGRITYRFAGFVDRTLLTREVLRATQ